MSNTQEAQFATYAQQWWSMSAQWLSWRPNEFWQATPIEVRSALSDPKAQDTLQGPSMDLISQMLERDKNG